MIVVLIKFKWRWDDWEEICGIAASEEIAHKYTKELMEKYPHCYGESHGTWHFEDYKLIEE